MQVYKGVRIKRHDLTSFYDEADYMIPQQVHCINDEGKGVIKVLSADTDVFVLLCGHFLERKWSSKIYMDPFTKENKVININNSFKRNENLVPHLIALHALSGCDTVPMLFNVGKAKAINAVKKVSLMHIGDVNSPIDLVIKEGKQFVAKCYGQTNESSSANRRSIWVSKTDGSKKSAKPPTLKYLPPTDEALELNIRRAHFVAIMWKNCLSGFPPNLDPCDYGWEKREDGVSLTPTMLPDGVAVTPEEVLKITRCNCASSKCVNKRCPCKKADVDCTEFCGCKDCENHKEPELEMLNNDNNDNEHSDSTDNDEDSEDDENDI